MPQPSKSREQLELAYKAALEIERRRRAAPMLFFREQILRHPKQQAFLEASRTHRRRLVIGGNRSGKSYIGRVDALGHAYGYRYWEVPNLQLTAAGDLPPREEVPPQYWIRRQDGIPIRCPNVGMVVTGLPRQRGIGQTIYPMIFEALPEAIRKKVHAPKSGAVVDYLDLPNGSRIMFASEEQEDMTFEGFTLDWAWIDEPVRQSIYKALWARLFDFSGPLWMTMTPLGAKASWLYGAYLDPPPDLKVFEMSMSANPANTAEMIADFERSGEYTDNEKKARLHGRFEFLGGRLLEQFTPEVHVVKGFSPPAEWIHICSVDPHTRRPAAIVWLAFDPETRIYHVYRERPGGGDYHKRRDGALPAVELATLIRNAEGSLRPRCRVVDPRYGPASFVHNGHRDTCFVDAMRAVGLHFDPQVPNTGTIEYGITILNNLMRYDRSAPIAPDNTPHLFIHEGCQNVVNSFMRFGYLDADDATKGGQRKLDETFKDFVDAVRYAVLYPLPATAKQVAGLQWFSPDQLREANDY